MGVPDTIVFGSSVHNCAWRDIATSYARLLFISRNKHGAISLPIVGEHSLPLIALP